MKRIVVVLCLLSIGCGPNPQDILEADRIRSEAAHERTMRDLDQKKRKLDAEAKSNEARNNMLRTELELRSELNRKK